MQENPPVYGPQRRVPRKTNPQQLWIRPADTQPEDFLELMQEVVPRLIQDLDRSASGATATPTSSGSNISPRSHSAKREASQEPPEAPASSRPRPDDTDEVLCAEYIQSHEHLHNSHVEVLMAAFLQKRMQKELPVTGNEPALQDRIEEAKSLEWETTQGKSAMRVWRGAKAREIRQKFPDRFIGTKFVVTNKVEDQGERIKARLCLQTHKDPDWGAKIASGECHSPTLSGLGRALLLQLLVSNHWVMNLGDIRGAFLEAGPLPERYRPLYAELPEGGIPGLESSAVLEITGNMYGANNAPQEWYRTFDEAAKSVGFVRSFCDNCLYFFRGSSNVLQGALGAHVDDTMTV